jgi:hypothetical protein
VSLGRGGVLPKNIDRPERYLNAWERVSDYLAGRPGAAVHARFMGRSGERHNSSLRANAR